jgi:hypothetical protein
MPLKKDAKFLLFIFFIEELDYASEISNIRFSDFFTYNFFRVSSIQIAITLRILRKEELNRDCCRTACSKLYEKQLNE